MISFVCIGHTFACFYHRSCRSSFPVLTYIGRGAADDTTVLASDAAGWEEVGGSGGFQRFQRIALRLSRYVIHCSHLSSTVIVYTYPSPNCRAFSAGREDNLAFLVGGGTELSGTFDGSFVVEAAVAGVSLLFPANPFVSVAVGCASCPSSAGCASATISSAPPPPAAAA